MNQRTCDHNITSVHSPDRYNPALGANKIISTLIVKCKKASAGLFESVVVDEVGRIEFLSKETIAPCKSSLYLNTSLNQGLNLILMLTYLTQQSVYVHRPF